MKKTLFVSFSLLLLGVLSLLIVRQIRLAGVNQPGAVKYLPPGPDYTAPAATSTPVAGSKLPLKVSLNVPFQVQAPNANWDAVHEEACEEASLIMLRHFINHTTIATQDQAEQEIQDLIQKETDHGYGPDVTVEELKTIASFAYGLTTGRVGKATVTSIKQELAAGHPVIIPAAGRLLPNPNFKQPGPLYHMLVVKGYDSDGFITNDPGTRNGENFRYSFEDLYFAIHNWDASDIQSGAKSYLVFD